MNALFSSLPVEADGEGENRVGEAASGTETSAPPPRPQREPFAFGEEAMSIERKLDGNSMTNHKV